MDSKDLLSWDFAPLVPCNISRTDLKSENFRLVVNHCCICLPSFFPEILLVILLITGSHTSLKIQVA